MAVHDDTNFPPQPVAFRREHPERMPDHKEFYYLNGYIENIRINDPSVTFDYTTTEPTHYFNDTFQTRVEFFNNLDSEEIQIVFQDNVRSILPPYDVVNYLRKIESHKQANQNQFGKYNQPFPVDYKGIKNTPYSNTGQAKDYRPAQRMTQNDPFPNNCVIIRKHYIFPSSVLFQIAKNLSESDFIETLSKYKESKYNSGNDQKHQFYGIIWSLFENDFPALGRIWALINKDSGTNLHIVHEYRIDAHLLENRPDCNGFYFEPVNVIISKELQRVLIHPYSERQILIERHRRLVKNYFGYHFSIEIVDNENHMSDRFMPMGKIIRENKEEEINVIRITPFKDPMRESGVYVTTVNSHYIVKEPETRKYTIDEASSIFNLYRTREDAKTHGNVSATIEMEIEKLKLENSKRKEELDRTRIILKEKEAEIERLKQEIEEEQLKRKDNYEEKSLKRKDAQEERSDYYDQRSHERKDNSELVKYLPTILVGIIGIAIALFKFI